MALSPVVSDAEHDDPPARDDVTAKVRTLAREVPAVVPSDPWMEQTPSDVSDLASIVRDADEVPRLPGFMGGEVIGEDETTEQLEPRLAALGVAPVLEALELLANHGEGQLGELQDPALTTKAPRLTKHDGLLDWALPAERLYCQFRALQPWPGVYTFAPHAKHPIRIIVQQMRVVSEHDESQPPGAVAYNDSQTLRVATGRGEIELIRVQPAGKREMEIAEFLRGHALPIGTRLGEE